MKREIHTKLTDANGCTVEIDGELEGTLIPLCIEGFNGTIVLGGRPDCPKGTLNFEPKPEPSVKIRV